MCAGLPEDETETCMLQSLCLDCVSCAALQKGKKEKSSDGTTRGGRPVTWYGGGGMNPQ